MKNIILIVSVLFFINKINAQCVNATYTIQDTLDCNNNLRPWVAFTNPTGGSGNYNYAINYSGNLLVNGDASNGLTGWNIIQGSMNSPGTFYSNQGAIEQIIDLSTLGFTDDELDCSPQINISFDAIRFAAASSIISNPPPVEKFIIFSRGNLIITLLDSNQNQIGYYVQYCSNGSGFCYDTIPNSVTCEQWQGYSNTIMNYPVGLRYIKVGLASCGYSQSGYECGCTASSGYLGSSTRFDNISVSFGEFVADSVFTLAPGNYNLAIQNADSLGCITMIDSATVIANFSTNSLNNFTDTAYCIGDSVIYNAQAFPNNTLHSINLDGADDWTHIEHLENKINNNNYSISLWAKTGVNNSVLFSQNDNGSSKVNFYLDPSGNVSLSNASTIINSSTSITDNNWHHIAYSYDASNDSISIFVDSVMVITDTLNVSINTNEKIALGCELSNNIPQLFFNGNIDDLKIWRKTMTLGEITATMNQTINSQDSNYNYLALYYPFETNCNISIAGDNRCNNTGAFYNGNTIGNGANYVSDSVPSFLNLVPTISYQWSNNIDGIVSSSNSINIKDSITKVWYYAMTDGLNTYYDTFNIVINPLPIINLGNDTTVCGQITLDAGSGFSYNWNTGSNSQTIIADSTAIYFATITDANTCVNADSISITVLPEPIVDLGIDRLLCTGTQYLLSPFVTGSGSLIYSWYNNSNAPLVILNTSTEGVGPHTYWVDITDGTGCTVRDSINIEISTCVGIDGFSNENDIKIYPNPTNDYLYVDIKNSLGITNIFAYNVSGQKIEVKFNEISKNEIVLNLSTFPEGMYLIYFISNEVIYNSIKVIKK